MPTITNSTHFQISGGTFYDVGGDVNLRVQQLTAHHTPHRAGVGEYRHHDVLAEPVGAPADHPTLDLARLDHHGRKSDNTTPQGIHITTQNSSAERNLTSSVVDTGILRLHQRAVLEASHDSTESLDQPKCHPDTRLAMLEDLWRWSSKIQNGTEADARKSVLWLHGPAGAGKSALMRTLALRLREAELLGGDFFFKRGHPTRSDARVLFVTLAYQLALLSPRILGPLISKAVEKDPSLVGKSMGSQFEKLIVEPCHLSQAEWTQPRVLLIDGLDECDGIAVQLEILRIIRGFFGKRTLPLKFIIASRPEPEIRELFYETSFSSVFTVEVEQAFADVEHFLRQEFARIHREHETMAAISTPWPSFSVLNKLVTKSSGYFVYAATVIRFVDDKQFRPTDQLEMILTATSDSSGISPLELLDKLYFHILNQVPKRLHATLLAILSVIFSTRWNLSIRHLEQLLDLKAGDVRLTLRRLHSVIALADDFSAIRSHHASFGDFLLEADRSSIFYIGGAHRTLQITRAALKILSGARLPTRDHVAWKLGRILFQDTDFQHRQLAELPHDTRLLNLDFFFLTCPSEQLKTRVSSILTTHDRTTRLDADMTRSSVLTQDVTQLWTRAEWINSNHCAAYFASKKHCAESQSSLSQILGVAYLILSKTHLPLIGQLIYRTRILLDLSWDEIISSMFALQSQSASIHAANPPRYPSAYTDISLGFLRLLRRISNDEIPATVWHIVAADSQDTLFAEPGHGWGYFVSQCSFDQLADEIHRFTSPSTIFHSTGIIMDPTNFELVLEWLKASRVETEMIRTWEGYLKESRDIMDRSIREARRKLNLV
ncbi:hypothetical protein FB45DRAFT_1062543 [Roridomyces roridus]|uniref:NACHT domain-containing protein n=1 Tax=Roridomyces roridus TaxID=1738132 RepID=A0AAD7BGG1_9AGAR|nr:hypothetical protein FB45DRAFT_1062543 [Roridomyces roridus]